MSLGLEHIAFSCCEPAPGQLKERIKELNQKFLDVRCLRDAVALEEQVEALEKRLKEFENEQ